MSRAVAAIFQQPMVPAEFGYSTRGALTAMVLALGMASMLFAFTL